MRPPNRVLLLLILTPLFVVPSPNEAAHAQEATRPTQVLKIETSEVTEPDISISPDGEWIVFTLLGHLFRLNVDGGPAEQLTFGNFYDKEPAVSSQGDRIAFVSDRGGGNGDLFVLHLESGAIEQLTEEVEISRPRWSLDGTSIVYLSSDVRRRIEPWSFMRPLVSRVKRVSSAGGESEVLTPEPAEYHSLFFWPDGDLGWAIVDREDGCRKCARTRIERVPASGSPIVVHEVEGVVDHVEPVSDGKLFYRRFVPMEGFYPDVAATREIEDIWMHDPNGRRDRIVFPVSSLNRFHWGRSFAVSPDGQYVCAGEGGTIWRVSPPGTPRTAIPFHATARIEVATAPGPPEWSPPGGGTAPPRAISGVELSPDGREVVFEAAGHVWIQSLSDEEGSGSLDARRLTRNEGWERHPVFSPDGRRIALIHTTPNGRTLQVVAKDTGEAEVLSSGDLLGRPSWSEDGSRIVFVLEGRMTIVDLVQGTETVLEAGRFWDRPHFSPDGQWVYATYRNDGHFYRVSLAPGNERMPLSGLEGQTRDVLLAPGGEDLAFRRNAEIWVGRMGAVPDGGAAVLKEEDVRQFSSDGGLSFTFADNGSSLLYTVGNRIWKERLDDNAKEEIPVNLTLPTQRPPPLLVENVRVLDFDRGDFSELMDVLLEGGRIAQIGQDLRGSAPEGIRVLEGNGAFAIPGLFDMHNHGVGAGKLAHLVAWGVTSFRDPGGPILDQLGQLDRARLHGEPIPRIFPSGEIFEGGQDDWWDTWLSLRSGDEARRHVRLWRELGAELIKVYRTVPWPLQRVIVDEGREAGLPIIAHGMTTEAMVRGTRIGVAGFEHSVFPTNLHSDVLDMISAADRWWDPTLIKTGGGAWLSRNLTPGLRDLAAEMGKRGEQIGLYDSTIPTQVLRGAWSERFEGIREAHERGVVLQAGTDRGPPGVALHLELQLLDQSGIPRIELLQLVTQGAAKTVGAEKHLGTIEPGKLADIALLERDPLDDIENTLAIWRVIKGGWVFDPDELLPGNSSN